MFVVPKSELYYFPFRSYVKTKSLATFSNPHKIAKFARINKGPFVYSLGQ